MKLNLYIETHGKKTDAKTIESAFRELWKEEGGRIKDLNDVELYYKPEEHACYYFIPETEKSGKFAV